MSRQKMSTGITLQHFLRKHLKTWIRLYICEVFPYRNQDRAALVPSGISQKQLRRIPPVSEYKWDSSKYDSWLLKAFVPNWHYFASSVNWQSWMSLNVFQTFLLHPFKVISVPVFGWGRGMSEAIMQLLRHLITLTCVLVHQRSGCSFRRPPCTSSIITRVYIASASVWGSCFRLSRYVFVCFW